MLARNPNLLYCSTCTAWPSEALLVYHAQPENTAIGSLCRCCDVGGCIHCSCCWRLLVVRLRPSSLIGRSAAICQPRSWLRPEKTTARTGIIHKHRIQKQHAALRAQGHYCSCCTVQQQTDLSGHRFEYGLSSPSLPLALCPFQRRRRRWRRTSCR